MSARIAPGAFSIHKTCGMWMDASDRNLTYGGCTICDVEWEDTYEAVQERFIAHVHDLLAEARYELDAWGDSFGTKRDLVDRLWHAAQKATA